MAGDWIKIEHALPNKPEVMQIAEILDISEWEAVGHLICFWTWVDQNLSAECPVARGTFRGLDRIAGREGFAQAMFDVGWLDLTDGIVNIPNYDDHLSQSAKARALEAKRKRLRRKKIRQTSVTQPDTSGTECGTREEKRREEKRRVSKTPLPPELDTVEFGNAWAEWEQHRREIKKKLTPTAVKRQINSLAKMGHDRAIAAIQNSITQGYAGIYEPNGKGKNKPDQVEEVKKWLENAKDDET